MDIPKAIRDRQCEVCGKTDGVIHCGDNKFNMALCSKHYKHMYRHGKILERTIYDSNDYIIHDDFVEIVMYSKNEIRSSTIIDKEDINKAKMYKWHRNNSGYAMWHKKGGNIFLHRLVMDCPEDKIIDHISHDKSDNRKSNLRICTYIQNCWNQKLLPTNTSGTTGVIWHKLTKKWAANIEVNKQRIYLGLFTNKDDAIKARKSAELKYYGEFAYKENEYEKPS